MESFSLQEELSKLQDKDDYFIANSFVLDACSSSDLQAKIDEITDCLTANPANITHRLTFDALRTFLKSYADIRPSDATSLADIILSGLYRMTEALARDLEEADHEVLAASRQCLEMYMFLLHWLILEAETKAASVARGEKVAAVSKPKGKGRAKKDVDNDTELNWQDQRMKALRIMVKVLSLRLQKLWQSNSEQDTFFGLFTTPLHEMMRNGEKTILKNAEMKNTLFRVLRLCVVNYGQLQSTTTSIEQNLQYFEEFLAEPMAELVYQLISEDQYVVLAENLLHGIGVRDITDAKHGKTYGAFLSRLSELAPKEVYKQMIYLQKHLDSEVYQMRSTMIEVTGNIILKHLIEDEDAGSRRRVEAFIDDVIIERFRDRHVQCRKKVLQVLLELVGHRYFYVSYNTHWKRTAHLIVGRLQDKTQPVRSQAIKTLKELLLRHPFSFYDGGFLDEDNITEKLTSTNEQFKLLIELTPDLLAESGRGNIANAADADHVSNNNQSGDDNDDDDELSQMMVEKPDVSGDESNHATTTNDRKEANQVDEESFDILNIQQQEMTENTLERQVIFNREYTRLVHHQKYFSDALEFVQLLRMATGVLSQLLASKNKSEVIDAMDFFVSAHRYKLKSSSEGIRKMMHLIWSKDASSSEEKLERSVKRHLIDCFKDIYLTPVDASITQDHANIIVRNLIMLTYDTTLADLTSLEQVISTVMNAGMIAESVVQKLWIIYGSKGTTIPKKQRRGAILILSWLAHSKPEVVSDHVDTLLKIGCGTLGKEDLVLAKYTCLALQRLAPPSKKKGDVQSRNHVRLPEGHDLFTCLKPLILETRASNDWFGLAEQIINTIYTLAENPDGICTSAIQILAARALKLPELNAMVDNQGVMDTTANPEDDSPSVDVLPSMSQAMRETLFVGEQRECMQDTATLSKLFFVLGHVAIKQLVHLEVIEAEYKRRRTNTKKSVDDKRTEAQVEDELENVVGTVDDEFADNIALIRERELLFGPKSLLASFASVVSHVCANNKFYTNRMLQTTAVLALCKFMCVSAEFCEKHLPLLFNILAKSTEPVIRSNAIIALGDMTVCFSTLIDQNISFLYDRLSDSDPIVRKNALMVLSHLVLNGMVKVKGQLSSMALCVESREPRIADLAKLFFEELASKENAIYNNMPDMISNLTNCEPAINEELFQNVMKYLFGFVTKERQTENLIEKLCARFKDSDNPRQWRDIAYCLTLLPYAPEKVETISESQLVSTSGSSRTERSIKKLREGAVYYQDKLHEDHVYKHLKEITAKAGARQTKQETKALIEELDTKLDDLRTQCVANHKAALKAQKANQLRLGKTADPTNSQTDEAIQKAAEEFAEMELDGEEADLPTEPPRTMFLESLLTISGTPKSQKKYKSRIFGDESNQNTASIPSDDDDTVQQTPGIRKAVGFVDSVKRLQQGNRQFATSSAPFASSDIGSPNLEASQLYVDDATEQPSKKANRSVTPDLDNDMEFEQSPIKKRVTSAAVSRTRLKRAKRASTIESNTSLSDVRLSQETSEKTTKSRNVPRGKQKRMVISDDDDFE